MASEAAPKTLYEVQYEPRKVLDSPDFRILSDKDEISAKANISCAFSPEHEMHLIQKPMPKAGKGECIVHIKVTGICGSDVHFFEHGAIGSWTVDDICGAGHESAGEIIEVGEGVTEWKVGDRVAIEAGLPCGLASCDACRTGRYNACSKTVFFSCPPYHGTLTRYHAHPAAWLHKLPDSISFAEGALCEPLCVALAGIERAGLRLGDPTLVCGAGPIGLVTMLAATAGGACPLVITDIVQSRLDFAKRLHPRVRTVLVEKNDSPEDVAAKIEKAIGQKPKLALECTGIEPSIRAAIFASKFGGKVFVIGVGRPEINFPFMHLSANEIDLQFQFRYCDQVRVTTYPKAIRLVSEGLIDLKPLATHKFPLDKAVEAFHIAADPSQGAIKVHITD